MSSLHAVWSAIIVWVQKNPSVVIALCALTVSVYTMLLSRRSFITTHRPFIYAISRTLKGTMDLNMVLIGCSNAPARIISIEFYYLVIDTKANGEETVREIVFQKKWTNKNILHPSEQPKQQISTTYDFKKKVSELDPEIKFRRKVRIDYKELSSNRTYFSEGNWDYNRKYSVWEDKNKFGN